jgi:hypothetical protein
MRGPSQNCSKLTTEQVRLTLPDDLTYLWAAHNLRIWSRNSQKTCFLLRELARLNVPPAAVIPKNSS